MRNVFARILQSPFLTGLFFSAVFSSILAFGSHFKATSGFYIALVIACFLLQSWLLFILSFWWHISNLVCSFFQDKEKKAVYVFLTGILLSLGALFNEVDPNSTQFMTHSEWEDHWIKLNPPSAQAVFLADQTLMTEYGRKIFYLAEPTLISGHDKLSGLCNSHSHNNRSKTLGCFSSQGNKIYLLKVSDSRLHGTMQVTAAHEMLHYAFNRLTNEEKAVLIKDLQAVSSGKFKKAIDNRMKVYADSGNFDKWAELHSILGTEFRNLSPSLEKYYAKYFSNRNNVVHLAELTDSQFENRRLNVKAFDNQLSELRKKVSKSRRLVEKAKGVIYHLEIEIKRTSDRIEANRLIANYNRALEIHAEAVKEANSAIVEYNSLVKQRNAVVGEARDMAEAFDEEELSASI